MAYDRFLIAPINTGLQTDLRPFIIPEDAFQKMNNAYVFRGRLRKRFGSDYSAGDNTFNNSRLAWPVTDPTNGSGSYGPTVAVPPTMSSTAGIGQLFVVGSATYTVIVANGSLLASQGSGTFNTTTGVLTLTGAPANTDIIYYPGLPVMGLGLYETAPITNQPAFAFDTRQPYKFNGTSWVVQDSSATSAPLFTGTDSDYFWTSNWQGAEPQDVVMFVSNNVDPIYYWDGADWDTLIPVFNSNGDTVVRARIIVPFQGHTVMLNTTEDIDGDEFTYVNRARWSAWGSPFNANSWLIPTQSYMGADPIGAGFYDAGTKEAIVGAEFIKDRLIVYFESSTWELAFTGNHNAGAFVWQKINTELGAVGTFSTIPFDRAVLGIGKTGVHACSGANVERIDQKIPDEVFKFKVKDNAYNRIYGIRVYQPELAIWSYVTENVPEFSNYANRIMVYNYENQTWSFNDDCVMCYGFFEQQKDLIWQLAYDTWQEANYPWNAWVEPAQLRQVIMGNQQGCICILRPDESANEANMLLTNINLATKELTIRNHNLAQNDYIYIKTAPGLSGFKKVYRINKVTSEDVVVVDDVAGITGTYLGNGTVARVSQVDIVSKQWNPYIKNGGGVYLAKILFAVGTTAAASIQVDYNSDASNENFVEDSGPAGTGAIMGTSALDMYIYPTFDTAGAARLWHPVYFQGQGNCVQVRIYYNDLQMRDVESSLADLEIDAIMLFTMRGSLNLG